VPERANDRDRLLALLHRGSYSQPLELRHIIGAFRHFSSTGRSESSSIAPLLQTMKKMFQQPSNAAKAEFWAVTTLFVFFIFFFITDGFNDQNSLGSAPNQPFFEKAGVPFQYDRHFFIPRLIQYVFVFLAFLYLNFSVIPQLIRRHAVAKNAAIVLLVFIAGGLVFGYTNAFLQSYLLAGSQRKDEVIGELLSHGFLLALALVSALAIYTVVKYAALYLLRNKTALHKKYPFFRPEGIVGFVAWMIGLLLLGFGGVDRGFIVAWMVIVPTSLFVYLLGFYRFIPASLKKKFPLISYLLRNLALMPLLLICVSFILLFNGSDNDAPGDISFLNVVFQLFVTVPLTWVLFKRKLKGNEELFFLKKELQQTTANIDFLRSQINPHFLFNALNTIYGTAIQEGAERTSEGIEKLGDMMRFMLQENLRDKISLSREIDYLNNYISLQKLRTDTSPAIQIQTNIHDRETIFQIAPMLLIPFVENAFKHGISFREPSRIDITLELGTNSLSFEVANTKHAKMQNDPEKGRSGIGLENVRQRLELVYPNRHELVIKDTAAEFFVHLTIQLA
jgi:two-component system LytT family sensor kinase